MYVVHSVALCCAQCFFAVHMKIIMLKQEKFVASVLKFIESFNIFLLGFFANNITAYSV